MYYLSILGLKTIHVSKWTLDDNVDTTDGTVPVWCQVISNIQLSQASLSDADPYTSCIRYIIPVIINSQLLKVCLHGTRQAAQLTRDMLQRDLLRGNSVYMVGSCRAQLLHIIHVSAVFGSVFFKENWGNCSRQHMPRGNYKFKLKLPPGLAAVARLLRSACRRVNAPVVFLCFYFCGAIVAPQLRCLLRPV